MPRLFGVDIAAEINRGLGPGLLDATLTVVTGAARTAGSLTGGTNPTTTSHTAKGFLDDYKDFQIDGTIVQRGDRMVVLLGASIDPAAVPTAGDRVTIEGESFNIVNVERDPAAATYTMQVRG
jgi:hypothetical protein